MQGEIKHRSHIGHSLEQRIRRHRHPGEMQDDMMQTRTLGQQAADWSSGFAGSWRFIFIYVGLTVGWCGLNLVGSIRHWDPYPFIFYTFSVSVLAILLSSLILLAGNRQAEIDRAHAENAYHHVDEVNEKQDQQLQILHQQLELLREQVSLAMTQHGEILSHLATLMDRGAPTTAAGDGTSPASAG